MSNKKTYWKGYDEKHQTPDFVVSTQNEFKEDILSEEFLSAAGLQDMKTGRRDFLKYMGFSVAAATLASCESPVIKSIPYVNKPEEITPGVANWYSSSYYDGNDFANVLVKAREGRPIWLKGKMDGITAGGLIPRISTSVLNLYNSARLEGPLMNSEASTWDIVDTEISKRLKKISSEGGNIRILSNTIISPSTKAVINDFANSFVIQNEDETNLSQVKHIQYDAISYNAIRKANEISFGESFIPNYSFDKAKVVVSVGADFIANWLLPTRFSKDFSKTRKPENSWMSKHYQLESVMSLSGANADVRGQIKPSDKGLIVKAILSAISSKYNKISVSDSIDSIIENIAKDLLLNRSESIVICDSNDTDIQLLVNAINYELGNYNNTINTNHRINLFQGQDEEVLSLIEDIKKGSVDALIIYGANPVYTLPIFSELSDALRKIPLSVSFSEFNDETASCCEFVCPVHNYLESWNDFEPVSGHYSIQQPLIKPLYNTRQAQESLLVWSGNAVRSNSESEVFHDYLQSFWMKNGLGNQTDYLSFDEFWNWSVHNGFTNSPTQQREMTFSFDVENIYNKVLSRSKSSGFELVIYQKELGIGNHAANPWLQELPDAVAKVVWDNFITMSPSDCFKVFDIDSNNPKAAWDGIHLGQEEPAFVAVVKSNENEVKLPVYPMPGQAPGTIGISTGYGRAENGEMIGKSAFQCDEFGNHLADENGKLVPIGENAFKLVSIVDNHFQYFNNVEVTATDEKYALACTQTHHTIMGRTSIVKETTYDFWKNNHKSNSESYNPKIKLHSHDEGGHSEVNATEYTLWDEHPVEKVGHRWGMSIDLSSCNGCGVCITACHSENNVPVVGKDEVRRSRDMHWLRMDRYFSSIEDDNRKNWEKSKKVDGDFDYGKLEVPEENPSVVFMPMLCQHCNHAPCETVCPVAATTHSNEGLNMMTYNRCIGTRYCANNCPYKVRRFNWFNYRDYRKFKNFNPNQDQMARLVLNPDVVVRSRGVMEKCSFCVQRIQAGKLTAKKESRPVLDGDVTTACADACPNDCITFGDWNDKESKIREVSESDRSYQALEEVGIKPNIWYQLKVRNIEEEIAMNTVTEKDHSEQH